ncbi:unnamed protein product [Pylaiella littoralis]
MGVSRNGSESPHNRAPPRQNDSGREADISNKSQTPFFSRSAPLHHNDPNTVHTMAPTEEQSKPGGGEGETPSPGVIGGAALVGAGIGALLSGPLVAIGLGGAAAALTLRKDQAGDVARSTGQAGLAVVEKGKEINAQYGVTEKVEGAAHSTYEKAKDVNEEHRVVDKVKAGASRAWGRIREVDREHRLTARAGKAFGGAMDGVTNAMSKKDGEGPAKK